LENQFCSLSVWDLLHLTPWVFLSEIFTRHSSLCLLSFGWDLSTRFLKQDWKWIFLGFLHRISSRNCFGKNFQKFHALQGCPRFSFVKFCPSFCNFILSSYYVDNRKSYTSTFICFFLSSKEARPKKTQNKIYGRKAIMFCFWKNKFSSFCFALGLGLIHLIPCVFWYKFFSRRSLLFVLSCGWYWSLNFSYF